MQARTVHFPAPSSRHDLNDRVRPPDSAGTLEELARVCRAGRLDNLKPSGHTTGFAALDAILPGGGWPVGALTELMHAIDGMGELQLLMPCLAQLTRTGQYIACIDPPYLPYPPALVQHGVVLEKIVVIHTGGSRELFHAHRKIDTVSPPSTELTSVLHSKKKTERSASLWAAEQVLRCSAFGAMLLWPQQPSDKNLRRLQLAAEAGRNLAILYRPANTAAMPSPAALRLQLQSIGQELHVRVHKCRGMRAGMTVRCTVDQGFEASAELDSTLATS